VKKELDKFLGRGRTVRSMTKEEAQAFLRHIKSLRNPTIVKFNKGVKAEAQAALMYGEEAYRKAGGRPGIGKAAQDRAYQQGVEAARNGVRNARLAAKKRAAAEAAGTVSKFGKLGRVGRTLLPLAGAATVLCTTGDVMAAGREAMLEVTGTDTPRDLALLAAAGYDEIVRQRDEGAAQVREEFGFGRKFKGKRLPP
jgi:hypothetical protein